MNTSQVRKLIALASKPDEGAALFQRLKTASEAASLSLTASQGVLRAAIAAGADENLVDDLVEHIDDLRTRHARIGHVLSEVGKARGVVEPSLVKVGS